MNGHCCSEQETTNMQLRINNNVEHTIPAFQNKCLVSFEEDVMSLGGRWSEVVWLYSENRLVVVRDGIHDSALGHDTTFVLVPTGSTGQRQHPCGDLWIVTAIIIIVVVVVVVRRILVTAINSQQRMSR